MAYSAGKLTERVEIHNPSTQTDSDFGRVSAGYTLASTVWASVDFSRGIHAMREGALDAYDYLMIRMRWNDDISRESRLKWNSRMYQIESLNIDKQKNQIQATVVELQK